MKETKDKKCLYCDFITKSFRPTMSLAMSLATHTWKMHPETKKSISRQQENDTICQEPCCLLQKSHKFNCVGKPTNIGEKCKCQDNCPYMEVKPTNSEKCKCKCHCGWCGFDGKCPEPYSKNCSHHGTPPECILKVKPTNIEKLENLYFGESERMINKINEVIEQVDKLSKL